MSLPPDVPPRPNVVFITVDQWRGDLMPGAGSWLKTPNLNQLALESVSFRNHYCQAYPCGPARAGLLTGLYPHKHRSIQNGTPLDKRHRTIFQAARASGYRPTLFGYTDTTPDPRGLSSLDPARANYEGPATGLEIGCLLDEAARPWIADLLSKGYNIVNPCQGRSAVFDLAGFGEPTVFAEADSETAFLTDKIIGHLRTEGPEPFFLHASFIAPHPPFAAAKYWLDQIDPDHIPMPVVFGDNQNSHPLLAAYRDTLDLAGFAPSVSGAPHRASSDVIRTIKRAYAALALEVDFHIGRIISLLKTQGKWDNTIFIFSGDHGEQLFDHGLLGKLGWYDASAHVPLMIHLPKMHGPKEIESYTQSIDLFPTLIELLLLQNDVNLDGMSLVPLMNGQATAIRDSAFWSHDFRNLSTLSMEKRLGLHSNQCNLQVVRTERFKYVHFTHLPSVVYDLREDPFERHDLSQDGAGRAFKAEGIERLLNMRLSHENEELSCLQAVGTQLYGSRTGEPNAVDFH